MYGDMFFFLFFFKKSTEYVSLEIKTIIKDSNSDIILSGAIVQKLAHKFVSLLDSNESLK